MSDRFHPLTMSQLAAWVHQELKQTNMLFGTPRELFYVPGKDRCLQRRIYGVNIDTPFGVAAGPHSQMAQNIITAWLCGARIIELKTVQTLDELDVPKPCIDMQDEGYNVEWSQELKIQQSFEEYLRAWVLIHVLNHVFGVNPNGPRMIFNMSVGYNLEGILKPNVQWFFDKMQNAGDDMERCIQEVAAFFPEARDISIPSRLSDSITLSTMHGCPPEEVGKISAYLIEEKKLHTNVKLNPTLLGPEMSRRILNEELRYRDVIIPDEAFEHDLTYPDAVTIIRDLQQRAANVGVSFGVKLSNTLEVVNHRTVFSSDETMMYMSGRPLQGLTVNLARRFAEEFDGKLMMSYAGGADAFNVAQLLRCGMTTVTTCSDILKPGGYVRLLQYVDETYRAMQAVGATSLDEFVCTSAGLQTDDVQTGALMNLCRYADDVRSDWRLLKDRFDYSDTKTSRSLTLFDCIHAPCTDECPINQKVPNYMSAVRERRFEDAISITREDNVMPTVLGRACTHICEGKCIRSHYDEPLAIREIKRFIMDQEQTIRVEQHQQASGGRIAVIGGGPCGISAACLLRRYGFDVTLYEARAYPGGMVSGTIPGYRASPDAVKHDLSMLEQEGVTVYYNKKAGSDFSVDDLLNDGVAYVIIATGAQSGMTLGIDQEDHPDVLDGLDFLRAVKEDRASQMKNRIGIIGGGDVAMDCARTAARLTEGKAFILYRRTKEQMPAQREELEGLLEEGVEIVELVAPEEIILNDGQINGVRCAKMCLGEPDASGRRRPVKVPGEDIIVAVDQLIVAIGQKPMLAFAEEAGLEMNQKGYISVHPGTMETSRPAIFAGGDAILNGPETIVKALGEGKRIAAEICRREGINVQNASSVDSVNQVEMIKRRATRQYKVPIPQLPIDQRMSFNEVIHTLSEDDAVREAERCLDCHNYCSICTSVCPNRAIQTLAVEPVRWEVPLLECRDGAWGVISHTPFIVEQPWQIAIVTNFCNECGNCATFCPTAGKPYQDKPRLYASREAFLRETENAFMIEENDGVFSMCGRFSGRTEHLTDGDNLEYRNVNGSITLNKNDISVLTISLDPQADGRCLNHAAIMYFILKNYVDSLSFLGVGDEAHSG